MRDTGKIGIAKVSIRSKNSLAAIRIIDNCIAMETIFYPDEIRPVAQVPGLPEQISTNEKELAMAKMLIEQLSTPFEPDKYTDDYRAAVLEAIQHKVAGEEIWVAPEQQKTNVIDLMAALQASLESMKPIAPDRSKPAALVKAAKPGKKSLVSAAAKDGEADASPGTPATTKVKTRKKAKETVSS